MTTAVCRSCAVEKLPLLIADAIAGDHRGRVLSADAFRPVIPAIIGAFWRGVAYALGRRTRPDFDRDSSLHPDDSSPEDDEAIDGQRVDPPSPAPAG